jgi:hypothetical protein
MPGAHRSSAYANSCTLSLAGPARNSLCAALLEVKTSPDAVAGFGSPRLHASGVRE